jgi:hypothetical protein
MRRPFFIVIGVLFLICFPLAAQEADAEKTVAAWYRDNKRAAAYTGIRDDITAIVARSGAALVPADVLIDMLDEGVSKGAPAADIVAALNARAAELISLKASLDRLRTCLAGNRGLGEDDSAELLRSCALFLRRGITRGVIEDVLSVACTRRKDFTAAFDALRTLSNIPSLGEIPEEKIAALGNAILGSGLSPSGYGALSSVYIKGKLKNISAAEVTAIIIAALEQGKGLIRIEQELNRRGGQ